MSNDSVAGRARAGLIQRAEEHLAVVTNCDAYRHDIGGCGTCGGSYATHLVRDLLAELAETPQQVDLELRLLRRQVERMALCPDHRDKATGRCIVCQAEERTRQEAAETGASPQTANEWRLDERGALDDVVVENPACFRLERMADDHVWGAVYHRDGSRTTFDLFGKRLSLTHEHEAAPVLPAPDRPQTEKGS